MRLPLALLLLLSAAPLAAVPVEPPGAPEAMTVAQAVDAALKASPELLDAVDQAASAAVGLSGTRSLFLPQVTPYYDRTVARDGTGNVSRFGVAVSQQFTFGPRLSGSVDATSPEPGQSAYGSAYSLQLAQPLLKGALPAVTREPLRAAERFVMTQDRSLGLLRRQTVVAVWTAYLNVVLEEALVVVSRERLERTERLVAASEAKLAAGTLSRLDVLRSQQLGASARSQLNETRNARDDAHDALARLTGQPPGTRFAVSAPERLPVRDPDEEEALSGARVRREDLLEARERVKDAEVASKIARSFLLPSLDAVAGWSASGLAPGIWDALTSPGRPSYAFGFRSQAPLNQGLLGAQKAQADIALATARRRAQVFEDDVVRAVRQSARRLRTAREQLAIDEANLQVAATQLEVANLRFEKGLSDNFNVVDAENLYNAARIAALTSKSGVLLAELDLLLQSALLVPEEFGTRR